MMDQAAFEALKAVFTKHLKRLAVTADDGKEFTLVTKSASPFPQHKGQPMFFGGVRFGKTYISFYLMPLYMCEELARQIPPALKKRMQGKSCFNFKQAPDAEQTAALQGLTQACIGLWAEKKWL